MDNPDEIRGLIYRMEEQRAKAVRARRPTREITEYTLRIEHLRDRLEELEAHSA